MFDVTRYATAAQSIVEAGRFLYDRGWSPATSSNYSARIDGDHVAITVSGRHKGQLGAGDVMVVDLHGQAVQSDCRSSAETLLHTVIYQLYSEVGAVLHTHSVKATVLSRLIPAGQALELEGYELQKAFNGVQTHEGKLIVPVFDNTQDIPALAEETRDWFARHPEQPGYLIRGHGLYTWGRTMADCLRHIEAFEFLFECELETMRVRR
ncbi:MAG TPA: methylthioribulose 1-phosphate dehydratase [Marinobacter hydrocarbonoclasticus]|uniref:Methylthioribulose-1-phosphate dehydratase n=2 Tax=Marinobacter nauticus TaxID=2743 RepID=A0A368UTW1_MARNT|nr:MULTISPECIES: methylthioribulose 1-phosphate dehydratase [Marinobacter]MBH93081.1 methylthioribulose 1-phosphate dehydratase [Marinobacter sp.]MCG8520999.1 methylthioribulose 1-phosphate dehydratase [Pseudomonadales bacterium]MBN8241056.1 methylthioribulose 1-phosphate dehydratase [Marinobacter nauticus]MBY6103344.1 methylthioribulose 1-phosphate dehydratase [Marinobacter nauticus]MCC4272666.1 methylthioribulose 1-phosphate dehydratase [Marinobacter nauticus]